ncbi:hypothetical protein RND71_043535 [Anisodus tanguticus]|uniref:Cysteine protease n=1 Tax=Anisodus tanguticus TaxID=243964 RepID=A0AAE1QPB1_9SOLA|nr:hypothetical protein RND71_043535 [Anisodus tanguticus]
MDHLMNKMDDKEANRLAVFKNNLRRISLLQELDKGTAVYGINEFADLSEQEFSDRFNGLKPSKPSLKYYSEPVFDKNAPLPDKVDWREKGAVTEVKNQGSCGSCWAFSSTGNIEGINFVSTGQLVSLSEQELVDCDKKDAGCGGGLMSTAFETLIEMGGIEGESDYPYKGRGDQCKFNKDLVKVKFSSYTNLTENEQEIAQYVAQHGPVAIGINASMMQFYFG